MPNSPLSVSFDLALTGKGAPAKAAYEKALADTAPILDWLREEARSVRESGSDQKKSVRQSGSDQKKPTLEILGIPTRIDDLKAATVQAAKIAKGAKSVAVLGIGGSSLGGQALSALKADRLPAVEFHDNPDPFSWAAALKRFDLKKTHFIAISKSGGTAETLMQVLTAEAALKKAGVTAMKNHFTVITEPHQSALADFADTRGVARIDHPTGIGGRYSVLTVVGMLPALLMGINAKALRAGAAAVLDQTLAVKSPGDAPAATGAALHFALAQGGKLATTILWPYADDLAVFGGWWRQLWAESLGKDGQGATPVSVLGPVDQHSQLQLFRDGPGNALFTMITVDTKGKGAVAPRAAAKALKQDYLAGHSLGDLVAAEARATAQTLFKNGRPVRQIHFPRVDAFNMGALMMHFMLETIIMGKLMGVDPFDQPGVEEGKILARKFLAEP